MTTYKTQCRSTPSGRWLIAGAFLALATVAVGAAVIDRRPMAPLSLATLPECERRHLQLFADLAHEGVLGKDLRPGAFAFTHRDIQDVVARCAEISSVREDNLIVRKVQDTFLSRDLPEHWRKAPGDAPPDKRPDGAKPKFITKSESPAQTQ